MADPWLTIIGLGEDGPAGLSEASRKAIDAAEVIFGGPRHLDLAEAGDRGRPWPVPFTIGPVLARPGRATVVLASGDPFCFGVGTVLAEALDPGDWCAHPGPSTAALVAARLGWRGEALQTFGLHAAPFETMANWLAPGRRGILLLRDGDAVGELTAWLAELGFGASRIWVCEALGGPRERIREISASDPAPQDVTAPVAAAVDLSGGAGLPATPGLPDPLFRHDGQITKSPVRALTLSALAPRPGERLWDIGAGSGSVSVEWCRSADGCEALAVEKDEARAANIRANAALFGLAPRLSVHHGSVPEAFEELPDPQAVFLGGGADATTLNALWDRIAPGVRVVANAVTLETMALITEWHGRHGGTLLKIDLAEAAPLGDFTGWAPSRTLVQWSTVR